MKFYYISKQTNNSKLPIQPLDKCYSALMLYQPSLQPTPTSKFGLIHSQKQHLSGLTNQKQIQATDENKMLTYFSPYYKKQSYSLSSYFHISTSLSFTELQQHQKIV